MTNDYTPSMDEARTLWDMVEETIVFTPTQLAALLAERETLLRAEIAAQIRAAFPKWLANAGETAATIAEGATT